VTYYLTVIARYSLFVQKVPLNPSKQTNNFGDGWLVVYVSCSITSAVDCLLLRCDQWAVQNVKVIAGE